MNFAARKRDTKLTLMWVTYCTPKIISCIRSVSVLNEENVANASYNIHTAGGNKFLLIKEKRPPLVVQAAIFIMMFNPKSMVDNGW